MAIAIGAIHHLLSFGLPLRLDGMDCTTKAKLALRRRYRDPVVARS